MTEPQEKEENASGESKQTSTRPPGRWNPFASLRMTISPDERRALLNLPRPLLPMEDFLSKEERKKLEWARRRPVIIRRLVAFAGVAALALLVWWTWPSAPHRDVQSAPVPPPAAPTFAASRSVAAPVVALAQPTAPRIQEPKPASSLPSEPIDRVPPKATVKPKVPLVVGTPAEAKPRTARAKPSSSSDPSPDNNGFWIDQR